MWTCLKYFEHFWKRQQLNTQWQYSTSHPVPGWSVEVVAFSGWLAAKYPNNFCTQTLLHKHFIHKRFYTHTHAFTHTRTPFHTKTLLHTRAVSTQTLLHTDAFTHTHIRFCTQTPSNTTIFAGKTFHTHRRFYAKASSHAATFTHSHFYTQTSLHTKHFYTQIACHTNTRTHSQKETLQSCNFISCFADRTSFRAKGLPPRLLNKSQFYISFCPSKSQFYISLCRSNLISCERVAPEVVKSQFYISFWQSSLISRERVAAEIVESQFFLNFYRSNVISCKHVACRDGSFAPAPAWRKTKKVQTWQ